MSSSAGTDRVGKRWTRVQKGWIGGVCGGLAKSIDVSPGLFRLIWLIATVLPGLNVFMYLVLWALLPREDRQFDPDSKMIFGVCLRLARLLDIEVAWVRVITILSPIPTLGTTILIYIVLAFVLPNKTPS